MAACLANAMQVGVGNWLPGLPGAGPRRMEPMLVEHQSNIIEATVLTLGIDQGRGYGGRHAPAMHERCDCKSPRPNVRAKRATTAGRQAWAGENVPRTARPGLVACRWRSA